MTTAASAPASANQAQEVVAEDDVQRATLDLVGDLATYRPNGKVVILEGGGDSDFDVQMVQRLFPEFAKRVNLLSGGGKKRVRDLYGVLAAAAEQAALGRFYAIVDADSDVGVVPNAGAATRTWDVYHIENYLLEPEYVRRATAAALLRDAFATQAETLEALRQCAGEVVPRSVLRLLTSDVNGRLVGAISIGGSPDSVKPADALMPSIAASVDRLTQAMREVMDADTLREKAAAHEKDLRAAVADGRWIRRLPGREILSRYVQKHLDGVVRYEAFRNLVIDQMADDSYQPPSMKTLLEAILAEP
jgi:hypothetical protein